MEMIFWNGLVGDLSSRAYVLIGLVSVQLTIMAVTLYLHRAEAHGAVAFHPGVAHFFRFWLWLTTGMVTREWVAIHRKHHAFSDRLGDPHSPVVKGLWRIFPLGVIEYIREARNYETIRRYGRGTPDDWIERHVYAPYPFIGVTLGFLAACSLFGFVPGLAIALAHVFWIPFWAAAVINGLGHWFGYRNYVTTDNSRNTLPFFALAVWIGGEELHNNHHAYATSAKFSHRWFEFDIGWGVITLLFWCNLATVKHRAPRPRYDRSKFTPDEETLAAIRALRFEVLSRFDRLTQHSRGDVDWKGIRARLVALWEERRPESELLASLRIWHTDALRSGSTPLQAFAKRLAQLRVATA